MDLRQCREWAVRTRSGVALFCVVALSIPCIARADHEPGNERIDYTAYTLQQKELAAGIGTLAFGVLDELTVGTYVLPWFAFPVLKSPVATGFVKVRDWLHGPVAVSLRANFVYLNASGLSSEITDRSHSDVRVTVIPLELSSSWRISRAFTQSLQLDYVHAWLSGNLPQDSSADTGLGGNSEASAVSLSALTEYRVSRTVALTVRGTVLLGSSDIVARATLQRRQTRVVANIGALADDRRVVANVIPGIALSWKNVNLQLGVGYGTNWLPYVAYPTRTSTVVPDVDLYLRF
jgi:hypothetical protein